MSDNGQWTLSKGEWTQFQRRFDEFVAATRESLAEIKALLPPGGFVCRDHELRLANLERRVETNHVAISGIQRRLPEDPPLASAPKPVSEATLTRWKLVAAIITVTAALISLGITLGKLLF